MAVSSAHSVVQPSPSSPLGHFHQDRKKPSTHSQLLLFTRLLSPPLPSPSPCHPGQTRPNCLSLDICPFRTLHRNRIVRYAVFVSGFQGLSRRNVCRYTVFMARRCSILGTCDMHRLRDMRAVSTLGLLGKTLLLAPACWVLGEHDSVAPGDIRRRGTAGSDGDSARPPRNSLSWSVQLP